MAEGLSKIKNAQIRIWRIRIRGHPGVASREGDAQATINQDLDLIKSCIEVPRVAARRAVVCDKDRAGALPLSILSLVFLERFGPDIERLLRKAPSLLLRRSCNVLQYTFLMRFCDDN